MEAVEEEEEPQKERFSRPVTVGTAAAVEAGGASNVVARDAVCTLSPLSRGPLARDGAAVTAAKLGACGAGEA